MGRIRWTGGPAGHGSALIELVEPGGDLGVALHVGLEQLGLSFLPAHGSSLRNLRSTYNHGGDCREGRGFASHRNLRRLGELGVAGLAVQALASLQDRTGAGMVAA